MKKIDNLIFVFVFLLVLSFANALILPTPSYISPINNSIHANVIPILNATLDVPYEYMEINFNDNGFASYPDDSLFVPGLNNWTVVFYNSTGDVIVTGEPQYFYYDTIAPNITVPSTITQAAPSASGGIVNYNVSSDEGTVLCSPASGSTFSVGNTVVTCNATDLAGNFAEKNFTVTLTYTAPSSGGGSSGGGGGSCTTQWTCGEWSACSAGSQTRTCTYPTNYCAPRSDKPLELRSCTVPTPSITNTTELESEESQPNFVNTITGNVIGTTAGRWSLGIIVFLIIIGLAYWIVAKKRKAAEKPAPVVKVASKKGKK